MADAGSPWDSRQQRWLQAMGYTVLRHGEPVSAPEVALPSPATRAEPAPVRQGPAAPTSVASPPRRAPSLDDSPRPAVRETVVEAPSRPAVRSGLRLPDRLQLAMLRASGLDPSDPSAQAEMDQWPVDELRGNGPAKRAFWPRLRALRRAQ